LNASTDQSRQNRIMQTARFSEREGDSQAGVSQEEDDT
jgi:hypothetical protein